MKLFDFSHTATSRRPLMEMNISNEDVLVDVINQTIQTAIKHRDGALPVSTLSTLAKRLVKAMKNDDRGNMVDVRPVTSVPPDAPEWLHRAIDGGQSVFEVMPKVEVLSNHIPHIIDWLLSDENAASALRTVADADLVNGLSMCADRFFERQRAESGASGDGIATGLEGCEVVMTFRSDGKGPSTPYMESSLELNSNGSVVSFWVKITTAAALDREGEMMNHCVGSYADRVKEHHVVIYSLRDMNNRPHVTIELQNNNKAPIINQVKGKGNRPPIGKYASFIKSFLNAIGAKSNFNAEHDLSGVGLFTHNGKYGDLLEIGSEEIETFSNGDSIQLRITHNESQLRRYGYGYGPSITKTYYYVEKAGTVPFSFSQSEENTDISNFRMFRDEVSKYRTYVKNMGEYLSEFNLRMSDYSFRHIGLFENNGKFGPLKDIADVIYSNNGIVGYGLIGTVFEVFFEGTDAAPFMVISAARAPTKSGWYSDPMINITSKDTKGSGFVSSVLVDFFNKMKLDYSDIDKDIRASYRKLGLIWVPSQKKFVSAFQSKAILFQCPKGSISMIGNILYVFDRKERLMATFTVTDNKIASYGSGGDLKWLWSNADFVPVLEVLRRFSEKNSGFIFEGFSSSEFVDVGYVVRNGRLIYAKDLENFKLPKGATMITEIVGSTTNYKITDGEESYTITVNDDGIMTRVNESAEYRNHQAALARQGKKIEPRNFVRRYAIFKALKLKAQKGKLIDFGLWFSGDKVVPIKPTDKSLLAFMTNTVYVTPKFYFENLIRGAEKSKTHVNGYLRYRNADYGDVVATVQYEDGDLQMSIRKRLPDEVSRSEITQCLAKFLDFYHSKIEPMTSDDIVTI